MPSASPPIDCGTAGTVVLVTACADAVDLFDAVLFFAAFFFRIFAALPWLDVAAFATLVTPKAAAPVPTRRPTVSATFAMLDLFFMLNLFRCVVPADPGAGTFGFVGKE